MLSVTLSRLIDDELRWREAELSLLKAQLLRDIVDARHFAVTYRSFVALTYAHYEAFTKNIISQAVSDIGVCGVKPSQCVERVQVGLFSQSLRKQIQALSNLDLIKELVKPLSIIDSISFPTGKEVLEISNMNVSNFLSTIGLLSIDIDSFIDFKLYIGRLVDLRHRCAHGERLTFDSSKTNKDLAEELFEIQARILLLMHALALAVIDSFEKKRFIA
jgi:hypothetical protein